MIKFLQSGNRAAKYILAGFLLILAASMVTYLIPGFMSGDTTESKSGVVVSVGGQEIRREDVTRIVNAQQQRQRYPDMFIPYLNQQALRQLIQQAEIVYEAERLGLKVSDEEIRDAM